MPSYAVGVWERIYCHSVDCVFHSVVYRALKILSATDEEASWLLAKAITSAGSVSGSDEELVAKQGITSIVKVQNDRLAEFLLPFNGYIIAGLL